MNHLPTGIVKAADGTDTVLHDESGDMGSGSGRAGGNNDASLAVDDPQGADRKDTRKSDWVSSSSKRPAKSHFSNVADPVDLTPG